MAYTATHKVSENFMSSKTLLVFLLVGWKGTEAWIKKMMSEFQNSIGRNSWESYYQQQTCASFQEKGKQNNTK